MSKRITNTICAAVIVAVSGLADAGPNRSGGRPNPEVPVVQPPATSGGSTKGAPGEETGPQSITLTATLRDFRAYNEPNGHHDFESFVGTTCVGIVAPQLDQEGKPVFASRSGREIVTEFRDREGRNINPALYDPARGDIAGSVVDTGDPKLGSERTFAQWYRDVAGVNASKTIQMTLTRDAQRGTYVFDSATDAQCVQRGGFFPLNGELYGNYANTGKNFHFTTEIEVEFTHAAGHSDIFTFSGDDDVWVFIDGKLAIDLGGVHPKREQSVSLDRLGLVDGQVYKLKIFHAERHTTQSNFRMETTLNLRTVSKPPVTALFD